MQSIASGFYLLLILIALVAAGFIIFHILRYSLRRSSAIVGVSLFTSVFFLLLLSNILLFANIPFDTLFESSFTSPPLSHGF